MECSSGFVLWFWYMNLGSEGFEVQFFQIWAWGFGWFLAKQVQRSGFLEGGSNRFEVRFWWTNLGFSEFGVRPIKLEAVRSSLYLGSIQH